MKEIKEYNGTNIQRLKRWMADAISQGQRKYFETLVDGIRVIHKTNKLDDFDLYLKWIDEHTQSMRVLVYNTKNSHRSQVFEFRTDKYLDGISDKLYPTRTPRLSEEEINLRVQQTLEEKQKKQAFAEIQKQNRELTRRLEDAEAYIRKLEAQTEDNKSEGDFDLNGLLSKAALFVGNNPELKDKLGGLDGLFVNNKQKTDLDSETSSEFTATFRKKPSKEVMEPAPKQAETEIKLDNDDTLCLRIPSSGLDDQNCRQLYDLAYFLSQNPAYISVVHGLMKNEESNLKE